MPSPYQVILYLTTSYDTIRSMHGSWYATEYTEYYGPCVLLVRSTFITAPISDIDQTDFHRSEPSSLTYLPDEQSLPSI